MSTTPHFGLRHSSRGLEGWFLGCWEAAGRSGFAVAFVCGAMFRVRSVGGGSLCRDLMKWWVFGCVNRSCGSVEREEEEEAKILWFGVYRESMTVF